MTAPLKQESSYERQPHFYQKFAKTYCLLALVSHQPCVFVLHCCAFVLQFCVSVLQLCVFVLHPYVFVLHTCVFVLQLCVFVLHGCVFVLQPCVQIIEITRVIAINKKSHSFEQLLISNNKNYFTKIFPQLRNGSQLQYLHSHQNQNHVQHSLLNSQQILL